MENMILKMEDIAQRRQKQIAARLDKLNRCTNIITAHEIRQEIAWKLEQNMRDLRQLEKSFIASQNDRDFAGRPEYGLELPTCRIFDEGTKYRIRFDGLLPIKTTSGCNLLCEDLEEAIRRYVALHNLTIPIFKTAVVIFCHYYQNGFDRRIRVYDYDNLERKSVVDALIPHFLPDDNPRVMRTMDMMLEGESDYTEILIMTCDAFRVYVFSENFTF